MCLKKICYVLTAVVCPFLPLYLTSLESLSSESLCDSLNTDSERLEKIFEVFFEETEKSFPEFATFTGLTKDFNGIWTDHTVEGYLSREQMVKDYLALLETIDREALSSAEQLNYDLFKNDLNDQLEGYAFQTYYMPIDQLGGIPLDVESCLAMMPKTTEKDYENVISRLSSIPLLMDQTIYLLDKGLEKQITPPQICLRSLPESLAKMIPPILSKSVFFQPFLSFPQSIDPTQQEQFVERALAVIEQEVYPAYAKFYDYLNFLYIPACRQTIGAADLPNGVDFYCYCVKKHTTTLLSPLEIHQIGLKEVARISQEMQKIMDEIGFSGSMGDFFHYLNNDPQFFYTEPESLIAGYKEITHFIDGQLPLLFGRLPILPYEVVPVPEFSQAGQVGAYYMRGSLATGRPGRFFANTYDIGSRPKWQMESLSLHEAVPGHHFQISLAQEIEGLPEFRKYNSYTAFIEGWGLYSESLGKELGLYQTPINQFGRLIEEVWRAVRLVVDTGMHAFGWSREQAIAYMIEKTGMNEREVTTEIDRYLVWPGQALAYKIGELSIQKWRRQAQEELKEKFDIRVFHDMLLEQGALPLDLCEKHVDAWIISQKEIVSQNEQ